MWRDDRPRGAVSGSPLDRLRVSIAEGDTVRAVSVAGVIDPGTAPLLHHALRVALDGSRALTDLVVDLAAVRSAEPLPAIAALAPIGRVARRRDVTVTVTHPPVAVRTALEETYLGPEGPVGTRQDGCVRLT